MRSIRRMSSKTKGIFWAVFTFFALIFISTPYQTSKGWSMVEYIVDFVNWIFPSLNWNYETAYIIEGRILGNLFIVFGIGFVISLVLFIVSYFKEKEEESPELKAIKKLPKQIAEELNKIKEQEEKGHDTSNNK